MIPKLVWIVIDTPRAATIYCCNFFSSLFPETKYLIVYVGKSTDCCWLNIGMGMHDPAENVSM